MITVEKMTTIGTRLNLKEKRATESDRFDMREYQPPAQRSAGILVRVVVSSSQNTIVSCTYAR
jgi:hypothetical protein